MSLNQIPNSIPTSEFRFDDSRQLAIYDYLKLLVGEGAASFYKDACRIMGTKPLFETTTHLVAHMLREIDSSMLGVLEGITESIPKGAKDRHKNQIKIILKSLDIPEEHPVAKAWLELTTVGLHGKAHRSGLQAARPLDRDFQEAWETRNSILHNVLEKFEARYIKVFEILDELAKKVAPTQEDVRKLKNNIPNNHVAHEHFFRKATSPEWLPLLEAEGFFKTPPPIEKDVERGVRHPPWPILLYLYKIVASSPDLVTKILCEIPDCENGNVKAGAIEVICKLPKQKKIELIPQVVRWLGNGNLFFTSIKAINLIKSLEDDREVEAALAVSKKLLEFVPEEKSVIPETGYIPSREPKTFIDRWRYVRFLKDDFFSVAKKDPSKSLPLLISILGKYCTLSHPRGKGDSFNDYSYLSKPAIETSERMHEDDVDDAIISTLLGIAVDAIETDSIFLLFAIEELEKQRWPVFKRIALYILSKYPTVYPEITAKYLLNTEFLNGPDYKHEYALLAAGSFHLLNFSQRNEIYDFIDCGLPAKEYVQKYSYDQEKSDHFIRTWQRDALVIFESNLDCEAQVKYKKLVQELGQAENPKTPPERGSFFVGPVSDVSSEELGKMSEDELLNFFKNWQPKKQAHGFGPSKEGLGRELGMAIRKDPEHFSLFAMRLTELDATYVRNYLQAFSEIVQNRAKFEWPPIINLCLWVAEQPRDIPGREGADRFSEDPDWGWTRRAAISLISHGLNFNVIPFDLYEKVWNIIQILTDDPNPTPDQELTKEGALTEDAYSLTINSVRGEAMTSVIEYGLWMSRYYEDLDEEKRPQEINFSLFPGMQGILEAHLVSDSSIAVRAVYGRYFPWLLNLDRNWAMTHLKDIFPTGQFGTPLYDAAWETYVSYVQPYGGVFDIMHDEYVEAVKKIGTDTKKNGRIDRDARLAEHLMAFFWHGKFDVTDDNGLFAEFWRTADEDTRLHAVDFLGRSLHSLKEPLSQEQSKLLTDLWEMRIQAVEAATDKKPYEKEMGAFGWWFASGKLEEDWSIGQFLRAVDLTQKVNADYFVIDRLVLLAETKPMKAIEIIGKLAKRDKQQWALFGNEADIKEILSKALNCADVPTQMAAKELTSRFVAWGNESYGNLLLPSPSI